MRIKRLVRRFFINVWKTYEGFGNYYQLSIERYLQEYLYKNPKYFNDKKLNKYEFKVFSQNGEDGIIEEIIKRIGETNKFFVEFGAGYSGGGVENNTAYLFLKGWSGVWLDANEKLIKRLVNQTANYVSKENKLTIRRVFITAENIETVFKEVNVPREFDVLSIDIDGNDYWVWKAIRNYSPRVVIIEYCSGFSPSIQWVMKYNPTYFNPGINVLASGASLKSMELLGKEKGYSLVGCDFTGTNAFFVRDDLVNQKFLEPYTSENHFEHSKRFLYKNTAVI